MTSGVTDAKNRFPLTTAVHSATCGHRCSVWLAFVLWGWILWLLQSASEHAPSHEIQGGELTDFRIVYTWERSFDVLQATGSLLLPIILCCFALLFAQADVLAQLSVDNPPPLWSGGLHV